jgi:hypothetical protein
MNKIDRMAERVANAHQSVPPSYLHLADRISRFLEKHGIRGHDGAWNGPDSDMMSCSAEMLRSGVKPNNPWSEWGSGCYRPYNDKNGKAEHDAILRAIRGI